MKIVIVWHIIYYHEIMQVNHEMAHHMERPIVEKSFCWVGLFVEHSNVAAGNYDYQSIMPFMFFGFVPTFHLPIPSFSIN